MKTKKYKKTKGFCFKKQKKQLLNTAGFVVDVGIANVMISTAKGLK